MMLARVPDCTRRAAGACRRLVSGSRDSWAPERLGVRTFNPIETHRSGLAHRPGSVNDQKHTFAIDYFRSAACRALLKVTWDGAVTVNVDEGRFVAFAKRPIRAGEIVEKGILRGIELGALDDAAHNPYVCKLGQDFLLSTGFPWHRSEVPGPPFLPSGALMFYPKSTSKYNVTVLVKSRLLKALNSMQSRLKTSRREPHWSAKSAENVHQHRGMEIITICLMSSWRAT